MVREVQMTGTLSRRVSPGSQESRTPASLTTAPQARDGRGRLSPEGSSGSWPWWGRPLVRGQQEEAGSGESEAERASVERGPAVLPLFLEL